MSVERMPVGIRVADQIKALQKEAEQLSGRASLSIRAAAMNLATECDVAAGYPLPNGEVQELKKMADMLRAHVERINAIRGRVG